MTRYLIIVCGVLFPSVLGCVTQCEEPVSRERVPVEEAYLSTFWSQPGNDHLTVYVTSAPYQMPDSALDFLTTVLRDQAGIEVSVGELGDTGLPASGVLDDEEVLEVGFAMAPESTDPVVVVIEVSDTDADYATYGYMSWRESPNPVAVVVIMRNSAEAMALGPISAEWIETVTLVHAVGHWFEVPARDYHISSEDYLHCANAQCRMARGKIDACKVLGNLFTGIPAYFCLDCAEELAEMRRLREE